MEISSPESVKANASSDRYLMTGYDKKSVSLESSVDTCLTFEIDVDGTDLWIPCASIELKAGVATTYTFPEGFSAYWVRARSSHDTTATVMFTYE
jgi:hypothetical protein